ncbi:hypothetical protein [Flavobacterium phragmitis]|uniref:hypothetical protein n=1 Tax=Flavobacterium phragmitis TaxID=739143 RepID=UPI0011603FBC|nr:hypothetical protein [Flavobacterium phragmitis]
MAILGYQKKVLNDIYHVLLQPSVFILNLQMDLPFLILESFQQQIAVARRARNLIELERIFTGIIVVFQPGTIEDKESELIRKIAI